MDAKCQSSSRRGMRRVACICALALAATTAACRQSTVIAGDSDIPTTKVREVNLQLKVFTKGELRTAKSQTISAPPIAGGTLQIVRLAAAGTQAHVGDVVLEFDPSQQEYNLAQNRSDLEQAEQEIIKAKADAAVQTAEDQTALLKAKFAVRKAELEVSKNEIVSQIDAQKNILALDEAKRALTQLQQDIRSHGASNDAALAISQEKRHKAQLAMDQAERNIKSMKITSPIDGLVVIHGNRDSTGGFFMDGMTLPDYHVGDQVNAGSSIAEIIDSTHLEINAQVDEMARTNLKVGQDVAITVDALAGQEFTGKVHSVGGATAREFWDDNSKHKFDVAVQFDHPDPRLRPGFEAQMNILGDRLTRAVALPEEAIFEHDGKKIVYCERGGGFEIQEVKVRALSEGQAVLEGVPVGTVVALVNPEKKRSGKPKESSGAAPTLGSSFN